MSERNTPADSADEHSTTTTKKVAGKVNPVQSAIEAIEDDVPVEVFRRLSHMKEAIGAIETWADDADPQDIDALVGAKTIVTAERERAGDIRQEVPDGNTSLLEKFDNLTERLENLADTVEPLEFSTIGHVVYVNQQFVDRYDDSSVSVESILLDAGKKDPDELGLFPLDGLLGNRQEDQAFPADRDLDLGEKNRTFFESTSDGGKIAYE